VRRAIFSPKAIALTLLAVLAVGICLNLGKWQWNRKEARDNFNHLVTTNLAAPPAPIDELMSVTAVPKLVDRWRRIAVAGTFDGTTHYVRGRSYHGRFGFAVVSRFIVQANGEAVWIDRGWVPAPGNAAQQPVSPLPSSGEVLLLARLRGGDSLDRQGPNGGLFGITFKKEGSVSSFIAAQPPTKSTLRGYLELISTTPGGPNQPVPVPAPEISAGPHLAYAVQWYLFALLIVVGRFLIGRDEFRTNHESAN